MPIETITSVMQKNSTYTDLTDLQVAHIQKEVLYGVKSNEFFSQFNQHKAWKKGSRTLEYKKLIFPKVDKKTIKPTAEGIAPRPTVLEYATFKVAVDNYRDRANYTRESIEYSLGDVVADSAAQLENNAVEKLDYIKGKPWVSSKATITAGANIVATIKKARVLLKKNKAKPWEGNDYLMLVSPEVMVALETELEGKASLDEATKTEIVNATVKKKYGFIIVECSSDLLYNDDGTTHTIVFAGKNAQGQSPVTDYALEEVEVIHNPLGSGVIVDEDGNLTNDANKQLGSVALNIEGVSAAINDDLCILNCKYTIETTNEASATPEVSTRTGFVSTSKSPK